VQKKLEIVASKSKLTVSELRNIVAENDQLQRRIAQALNNQVLQLIMNSVLHEDDNEDFTLNEDELEALKVRFDFMIGIHFDESNFEKFILADQLATSISASLFHHHSSSSRKEAGNTDKANVRRGKLTLDDVMKMARNLLDDRIPEEHKIFRLDPSALLPS
jgi:hypothetical protein